MDVRAKTVLIGYQRKLPLSELASLLEGTSRLEVFNPNPSKDCAPPSSAPAPANADYDGECNSMSLRAFAVLMAHSMVQTKDYRGDCPAVKDLVATVNSLVASSPREERAGCPTRGSTFNVPDRSQSQLLSLFGSLSPSAALSGGGVVVVPPSLPSLLSYFYDLSPLVSSTVRAHRLVSSPVVDLAAALSLFRLPYVDDLAPLGEDVFGPEGTSAHRGMVSSASNLRLLLEGYSLGPSGGGAVAPGSASSTTTHQPPPSRNPCLLSPYVHGPAADALAAAFKVLSAEVAGGSISTFGFPLLDVQVGSVVERALSALKNASEERQNFVGGGSAAAAAAAAAAALLPSPPPPPPASGVEGRWSAVGRSVDLAERTLAAELSLAGLYLSERAAAAAVAAQQADADEEAEDKAAAERGAPAAAAAASSNDGKQLTEAQAAKAAKIRAEKEAKAALKAKAKAEKKARKAGGGAVPSGLARGAAAINLDGLDPCRLPTPWEREDLSALLLQLSSGGQRRKPKIAKGTRDYLPEQMNIRDQAFQIIRRVFKRHGAVEIDTPVFELKETLTGKYGEDSKLIYDLADQGGELLALRYDLTVPFARFLALNAVGNIKRYHVGKVYRRDNPAMNKGRYREFYQCDFDIAGTYGRMVPDAECLCVASEILGNLPIGDFAIKVNHRRLLDAVLDIAGVPADKFRTICSAVDKLDKEPWETVKKEMVEKGIDGSVADRISTFVLKKSAVGDAWTLYKDLMSAASFGAHQGAMEAMEDLRLMFTYLEAMGKLRYISFDLSLARGLDYYTGVIYEAVCLTEGSQVGSIGGGGRYDNLVSMFEASGTVTPCVGVSVGIERVFTLMEANLREKQGGSIKQPNVKVLVSSVGEGSMMIPMMEVTKSLWEANISAEFTQTANQSLKNDLKACLERSIPFLVIVGEEELKKGLVKVKDLQKRTEEDVPVKDIAQALKRMGVVAVGCEFAAEEALRESLAKMSV